MKLLKPRANVKKDEYIQESILRNASSHEEQTKAWYSFINTNVKFPLVATYHGKSGIEPFTPNAKVQVIGLAKVEACKDTIHVRVMDGLGSIRISLECLWFENEPLNNVEALHDWQYWYARQTGIEKA